MTSTRLRTSLAAPVVAWTTGMKTPSTSTVTSTEAMAAKLGTALRDIERSASRRKKPIAHQSRNASSNSSPGSRTRWGSGAGSRRSAPNSAVDMSRGA